MGTETRTVRIGEKVGPIDWGYDFASHDWDHGGVTNPKHVRDAVERLRMMEGTPCEATTDGGWPRVGWGRVIDAGMYDGWPYWRPVPSVLIAGTMGAAWHSFCMVTEARPITEAPTDDR